MNWRKWWRVAGPLSVLPGIAMSASESNWLAFSWALIALAWATSAAIADHTSAAWRDLYYDEPRRQWPERK